MTNGWTGEYGWGTPAGYSPGGYGGRGYGDYPVPVGVTPGAGLRGVTWGPGVAGGLTDSGYAFYEAARAAGTRSETLEALRSFLTTEQGRAWEASLTYEQAREMLRVPMQGADPNLPWLGAGWPAGRVSESLLPSAERPYGGGDPYAATMQQGLGGQQTGYARGYGGGYGAGYGATPGLLTQPDYRLAYLEAMPKFKSPAMEAYYKTQAGPIYQEYLVEAKKRFEEEEIPRLGATIGYGGTSPEGRRGAEIRMAEGPTEAELVKGFSSYLGGREARRGRPATKGYPWWEKWIERPPSYRGEYTARYQPRTRWLMY